MWMATYSGWNGLASNRIFADSSADRVSKMKRRSLVSIVRVLAFGAASQTIFVWWDCPENTVLFGIWFVLFLPASLVSYPLTLFAIAIEPSGTWGYWVIPFAVGLIQGASVEGVLLARRLARRSDSSVRAHP